MEQSNINGMFWIGMILGLILIWYFLLTPEGALRKEVLTEHPVAALSSKIDIQKTEMYGTMYHFVPSIQDESGKDLFYGCSKSNFVYKCSVIKRGW